MEAKYKDKLKIYMIYDEISCFPTPYKTVKHINLEMTLSQVFL